MNVLVDATREFIGHAKKNGFVQTLKNYHAGMPIQTRVAFIWVLTKVRIKLWIRTTFSS